MKAKKIYNSDIEGLLISSLPTRPTLSYSRGGAGYSASDMKAAFDKLPLLIIEKYNNLIDDVHALGDGSLASDIPTGIKDGHTLGALFEDLASGELATYFNFLGKRTGQVTTNQFYHWRNWATVAKRFKVAELGST